MPTCRGCGSRFRIGTSRGRPRQYCSECRPGGSDAPPVGDGVLEHECSWVPAGATKKIGGVVFEMDVCAVRGCGDSRARRPGLPASALDKSGNTGYREASQ